VSGFGERSKLGVLDNMKDVAELVQKLGDVELYRKILALEIEVREVNRDKLRAEDKVEELERALRLKQELVFDEPFYWLKGDPVPFCPACWIDKQKAIHVTTIEEGSRYSRLNCPLCKHNYDIPFVTWSNVRRKRLSTSQF
jgi:hypothetical protein